VHNFSINSTFLLTYLLTYLLSYYSTTYYFRPKKHSVAEEDESSKATKFTETAVAAGDISFLALNKLLNKPFKTCIHRAEL